MNKLLLSTLLLALSTGAVAQTQAVQTSSGPAITSNGPVVAGFGNQFPETGDAAEMRIAKEVRHELLLRLPGRHHLQGRLRHPGMGRLPHR